MPNPRNEDDKNELHVDNSRFIDKGLYPILLEDHLLHEIMDIVKRNINRCNKNSIVSSSYWNKNLSDRISVH